jgi:predicted ester cyclase
MSVEENKKSCQRCFDEIWNNGDLSVIPDLISPDYVGYSQGVATKGIENFEQNVKNYLTGMPDMHWTVDEMIGEGESLAVRLNLKGTMTGKIGDTEPTGAKVDITFVLINRYVDAKCVEATAFGTSGN